MTTDSTLGIVIPEVRQITVAGEIISISPFRVGHLKKILKYFNGFTLETVGGEINAIAMLNGPHADGLYEACALAAKKDRAWVDELYPHELITLAETVFEVNINFFARARVPGPAAESGQAESGLTEKLADLSSGEKSSTSSLGMDTATQTS